MGKWSEISVEGHLCEAFEPAQRMDSGDVLVYLHGADLDRLVDQPAFETAFDKHGVKVLAPQTGRSWWTDKIFPEFDPELTAERHVLKNILPWIASNWGAGPPQIGLLGTGMGGQGALRFAFKYPDTFPVVAALSPEIDYQICWNEGDETLPQMYCDAEAVRQDTATLHIHPLYWPRNIWFCCDPEDCRWLDSSQRLQMKLGALGIPHQCNLEAHTGSGLDPHSNKVEVAMEFLAKRLDQERHRII